MDSKPVVISEEEYEQIRIEKAHKDLEKRLQAEIDNQNEYIK